MSYFSACFCTRTMSQTHSTSTQPNVPFSLGCPMSSEQGHQDFRCFVGSLIARQRMVWANHNLTWQLFWFHGSTVSRLFKFHSGLSSFGFQMHLFDVVGLWCLKQAFLQLYSFEPSILMISLTTPWQPSGRNKSMSMPVRDQELADNSNKVVRYNIRA